MFGHEKRQERDLKERGARAWATILETKKGRTTSGGVNVTIGQVGSFTIRREFRVRVEPDGEPPFETWIKQNFNDAHGPHVPEDGWSITVIYDPSDRASAIMDLDGLMVEPGFDRATAVAVREKSRARRAARAAAPPGEHASQVGELRAVALDQTLSPEEKRARMMELSASLTGRPPPAVPPPRPAPAVDAVEALTKLADLRDRGALTDAEFEAQKAKILGSS